MAKITVSDLQPTEEISDEEASTLFGGAVGGPIGGFLGSALGTTYGVNAGRFVSTLAGASGESARALRLTGGIVGGASLGLTGYALPK